MGDHKRSSFPLPHFLQEEYRRAKEHPEVVELEEEREWFEEERREARASSRRRRFLNADRIHEPRVESDFDEMQRRDDDRHR